MGEREVKVELFARYIMDDIKIIKLQHFFQVDFEIKKEMYRLAPSNLEYYDELSIQKYTDELDDLLTYIFSELKCVTLDIFGKDSNVISKIFAMEQVIKQHFYSCGFDMNKLKIFYETYISNMTSKFIDSVKRECVGYTFGGTSSIELATSLNEILHFLHSYVLNNENILQSIQLINEKNNIFKYPIKLRGKKVDVFERLFYQFPTNIDVGWTDMVVINEKKLIMMVRDRGHALLIEISLNGDMARIEYFIPKLCNIDMINALPGINKVNNNSVGATGIIEVNLARLNEVLFDFISKVPTDSDMILDDYKIH